MLSLLPSLVHAASVDDPIPSEIRPLIDFMAVASGDAKMISQARSSSAIECIEEAKVLTSSIQIPLKKEEGEWKFSVLTSVTGPKSSFAKDFKNIDPQLGKELDQIIKTKFDSHDQRMSAVASMCEGKSESQVIQMASLLGGKLANIYDYQRQSGEKVYAQDQWEALYQRAANRNSAVAGVCREATFTVSQFLVNCGFSKEQISIQSYSSLGGGHQVVSIRDKKGELFTINWSELYSTNEKGGITPDLNPSNIQAGLDYHQFDADGKLVGFKKTELGDIIKAVSGGSVNDPNYLPQVLRLEASFGALSTNLFTTQTRSGEKASGISAVYKKINHNETAYISMGSAYVRNEKDLAFTAQQNITITQDILYFQIESGYKPTFDLYQKGDVKVSISPGAMASTEVYRTQSKIMNSEESASGIDSNLTGKVGAELKIQNGNMLGWIGVNNDMVSGFKGSNEVTGVGAGIVIDSTTLSAGLGYKTKNYVMTLEAQSTFSHYDNNYSVATSILSKNNQASASIMYQVYERGDYWQEQYVMVQGEKNFKFEKVGRVAVGVKAQVPLDGESDATYFATLKFGGGK